MTLDATLCRVLSGLERAASAVPGVGRRLRQLFTRIAPVHVADVRGLALKAILPLHQVGTYNEFKDWAAREPEVLDWIDGFEAPFLFVDVGSNFGTESLYCAKRHDKGQVIACDPEFLGGYNLAVNIALNGLTNVENYAVALGDQPGWLDLPENLNYLHLLPGRKYATLSKRTRVESIDSLLDGRPAHYLKIDVDGLEQAILDGARATLASGNVRSLIVEVDDPKTRPVVIARLEGAGFGLAGQSGATGNNLRFAKR